MNNVIFLYHFTSLIICLIVLGLGIWLQYSIPEHCLSTGLRTGGRGMIVTSVVLLTISLSNLICGFFCETGTTGFNIYLSGIMCIGFLVLFSFTLQAIANLNSKQLPVKDKLSEQKMRECLSAHDQEKLKLWLGVLCFITFVWTIISGFITWYLAKQRSAPAKLAKQKVAKQKAHEADEEAKEKELELEKEKLKQEIREREWKKKKDEALDEEELKREVKQEEKKKKLDNLQKLKNEKREEIQKLQEKLKNPRLKQQRKKALENQLHKKETALDAYNEQLDKLKERRMERGFQVFDL